MWYLETYNYCKRYNWENLIFIGTHFNIENDLYGKCRFYFGKNLFKVSSVPFAENPHSMLLRALIAACLLR